MAAVEEARSEVCLYDTRVTECICPRGCEAYSSQLDQACREASQVEVPMNWLSDQPRVHVGTVLARLWLSCRVHYSNGFYDIGICSTTRITVISLYKSAQRC